MSPDAGCPPRGAAAAGGWRVTSEELLGAEHADTVQTLTDLAICYLDQGLNRQGRPLLERALALQEKALGGDHADVAAIRDVLTSLDMEGAK